MGEGFKKFKKRATLSAILKSAIVGVFCALLAIGLALLIVKAKGVRKEWYLYVIAGACALCAGFGVTFLFTVQGDKKLAKRIDGDYALNEKVQTMVEFSGQEGAILGLQRKDANETLKNLPRKKPSFKRIWQYIAVSVVGCAVFVTGVIFPSRYTPTIPADGFEIDPWQSVALSQLVAEVNGSELEEKVKTPVSEALGTLLEELKSENSGSSMRRKVTETVKTTDEAVIAANTYRDIATAMHEAEVREKLNSFKSAIIKAAEAHGDRSKITSIQSVSEIAEKSEENIGAALGVFVKAFETSVNDCAANDKLAGVVADFRGALNLSMDDETLYEKMQNDTLYLALSEFSSNLGGVEEGYKGESLSNLRQYVQEACESFVSAAQDPLATQCYNNAMDAYVRNRLAEIFKVHFDDFAGLNLTDGSDDDGSDDDNKGNTGGAGDNENVGNDEKVFDPVNEEYLRFIDLWAKGELGYEKKVKDYIDSLEDPELKEYLENYFHEITQEKKDDSQSN